ncbi:stress-inducible protein [Streptomyces spiroverticillatus]|uniref:Stress-inducible protein n=1 Tax=Streptomyces finlayi TaxID=67296 RepID=A0A918WX31_9ACTN|nr:universal stress protein [Streptomyces finlayi]GHA08911.1 stress-inducible protein [Streptomyces spiroverticillatus]GHC91748.1 stress-inducible protein [Streptomyces finlayi]
MLQFQPIVAGLDGSRESVAAAHWAAREAQRRSLPLRLVHAWEGLPVPEESAGLPELRVPQYWARRVLRNAVEQLTEAYPQVYISAEQIAKPPTAALVSEAARAELVVLGNHGFGGPSGLLTGSVAMAVVTHARTPVVLVRAGCSTADELLPGGEGGTNGAAPYREVAVALDLAHTCDSLLEFAFEEARSRATVLRPVHVWYLASRQAPDGEAGREAAWALETVLEPWREKFPSVEVHPRSVQGRPAQEVMEAARDAGLLVIGRQVRHAALGSHLGRVAHAAIHHVRCPVAVVPHD